MERRLPLLARERERGTVEGAGSCIASLFLHVAWTFVRFFFLLREEACFLVRHFVSFFALCTRKNEGPSNARSARRSSLKPGARPGLKGQQTPSGVDGSISSIIGHCVTATFTLQSQHAGEETLERMPAKPHLAVIGTRGRSSRLNCGKGRVSGVARRVLSLLNIL
ncbi:uncharacterized protein LOC119179020 [Rhipicephalus microplus]|uniref:uncharacterized protein LOC119179020 n=1 Tax=Rhipicephalus microplus TaxID=6941 RepID=UPI003F6AF36E